MSRVSRFSGIRYSLVAAALLAPLLCAPAQAQNAVADFYRGKTVRVMIGYSAGGGYDLYARILIRHMARHIPGNPSMIPENMPGAGSLRVVNFLYSAAPKDGTVFGTFGRGLAMEPLLARSQNIRYDATKFGWIGSVTDEVSVCAFWHTTGIRSWDDLKAAKKEVVVGGTGSGSDTDIYPTLMRNLFHLPLKLVTGFPGGSEVNLALQRGEVDGRCGWSWSSLMSRERPLWDAKQVNVVVQFGLTSHEDIPNVPTVISKATSPKENAAVRLIVSRQTMARPFAAPPDVPADRIAALRAAFNATMRDPEFLAEAEKTQLEVRPIDGAAVEALVKELYASPPDVVQLAIEAIKGTP